MKISEVKSKKTAIILTSLIIAVSLIFGSGADTAKATELDDINDQIKEKQKELDEGKKQEEELLQAIGQLEEQIDQLQMEINNGE